MNIMTWWKNLKKLIVDGNNEKVMSMLKEVSIVDARDDYGSNLLYYFTDHGNEFVIKQLLAAGCDVNVRNRYGETPLMAAIEVNNLKVAKLLLDAGAAHINTDFKAEFGPLHMAVFYGYKDMVKMLLDAGADVNIIDDECSSPLHIAAKTQEFVGNKEQNLAITRLLIEAGADINAVNFQAITPLHWAVMRGNYAVADLLLIAGAVADVMDENFVTPLHWAVRDNNVHFAKRLIQAGADIDMVDCNGMTSLHYAIKANYLEMVRLLLQSGATPNCTDDHGYSPLHWAVREKNIEFIKLLIEAAADVNIQDNEEDADGLSALQVAAEFGFKDIILILLDHGADVKATCNRGYSVLYYAAMSKRVGSTVEDDLYVELLKLLLERGADVCDNSQNIKTPFNSVLLYGNERAVRLFIEHGVDLSKRALGKGKSSSLHHAAFNNDKSVLKYLVNSGHFDIEEKFSGLTALHLASFWNKVNCIRFLIKRGANVNSENMYGETPLYSAILNGHSESVRILLECNPNINARTMRNESMLGAALEVNKQAIVLYIVRHIAKIEVFGESIDQRNFDLIREFEDLQNFYENCRAELALLEESVIYGTVSFFKILTAADIGSYVRNEHVLSTFEMQELADYFPIYHDLLFERFSKELKRQALMKKAMIGLSKVTRCDADTFQLLFYNILSFLSNKDLRRLILV